MRIPRIEPGLDQRGSLAGVTDADGYLAFVRWIKHPRAIDDAPRGSRGRRCGERGREKYRGNDSTCTQPKHCQEPPPIIILGVEGQRPWRQLPRTIGQQHLLVDQGVGDRSADGTSGCGSTREAVRASCGISSVEPLSTPGPDCLG